MLILTRKAGESVVIANGLYCKILKIKGNHVHLGFEAPRDLTIHREEIHERIKLENEIALMDQSEFADEFVIEQLMKRCKEAQDCTLSTH